MGVLLAYCIIGKIQYHEELLWWIVGRNMSNAEVTYVTTEMREAKGVWGPSRSSYPITDTDIRRWAMATYYPKQPPRIYWDSDYAKNTSYGGIIAPPDFNPFAWSMERPVATTRGLAGARADGKSLTGMNGGQTDTYGVPMRPGDVITARSRLVDWEEREGRLGHTLYVRTEIEWRNQSEELVKTRISIAIRY